MGAFLTHPYCKQATIQCTSLAVSARTLDYQAQTKLHRLEETTNTEVLTSENLHRIKTAISQIQIQGNRYTAQMQKAINS